MLIPIARWSTSRCCSSHGCVRSGCATMMRCADLPERQFWGDVLFLPSLNFLYLLGLIEYHPKTDSIEYVGQNEAV